MKFLLTGLILLVSITSTQACNPISRIRSNVKMAMTARTSVSVASSTVTQSTTIREVLPVPVAVAPVVVAPKPVVVVPSVAVAPVVTPVIAAAAPIRVKSKTKQVEGRPFLGRAILLQYRR